MHGASTGRRLASVFGVVALLLSCSAVGAAERYKAGAKNQDQTVRKVVPAPNARMVALIRPGPVIVRHKGARSVTRIARGVYCIRPLASTGINPRDSVALVSVEYFNSRLSEVKVQWAQTAHGCGGDRFGVYTLSDPSATGLYDFSNDVGFVIYVP